LTIIVSTTAAAYYFRSKLFKSSKTQEQPKRNYSHIPGPKPYPILGTLPLIYHYSRKRQSHLFRDYLLETYGTIAYVPVFGADVIYLSDADAARQVLNDTEQFVRSNSFQYMAKGLFKYPLFMLPTGEVWKKHRKFLQPGFGPTHLRSAVDSTNRVMDTLFEIWDKTLESANGGGGGSLGSNPVTGDGTLLTDMFHVASSITVDVIGHVAFSYSYDSVLHHETPAKQGAMKSYQMAFEVLGKRMGLPAWLWGWAGVGEGHAKALTTQLRKTIMETIETKRANLNSNVITEENGTDQQPLLEYKSAKGMSQLDVLDRLLEVQKESWTDEEMVDEVLALFLAGGETSANTIVFVLLLLSQHPKVLQNLQQELDTVLGSHQPSDDTANTKNETGNGTSYTQITWDDLQKLKYTEQVIKETLRLHPVLPGSAPRLLTDPEGCTLVGKHLPHGTHIIVNIRGIHHAEAYWGPDAMKFDPSRWDNGFIPAVGTYIPFLDGPHMCLGYKMAMLEIKTVIARICHRYQLSVIEGESTSPVTAVTHGFKDGLRMKVKRRGA
jgi:cytochrome P450